MKTPRPPYAKRPLCLVISTGRCGSTALSNVLGLHPSIVSVSELFSTIKDKGFDAGDAEVSGEAFWSILSEPVLADSVALRNGAKTPRELLYSLDEVAKRSNSFTRVTGIPPIMMAAIPHLTDDADRYYKELGEEILRQPSRSLSEHFSWLFRWFASGDGTKVVVERSGGSLSYARELLALFPESQVIHLYRDGRDCAMSMQRHPQFKFALVRRQLCKRLGWDPYDMRFPPHDFGKAELAGNLACFLPETFNLEQFEKYYIPLEKYGAFWSSVVLRNVPVLRQHLKVLDICYEDLATAPVPQLRRMCEFLRLDHDLSWERVAADALHSERIGRWRTLALDKQRSLTRMCGAGMEYLYGHSWQRSVEGES